MNTPSLKPILRDGQRQYLLNSVAPTLIGRQGCAILLGGTEVAPKHARVVPSRKGFVIEAMEGEVIINDAVLASPRLLQPGDALRFGTVVMTYEGPGLEDNSLEVGRLEYDELFQRVKDCVVGIQHGGGSGSGFFVHPDGIIVSNRHVVGYERTVRVQLVDGRQLRGRVMRAFPEVDLAFIRVEGVKPVVPPLAPAGSVQVGQAVLVIGHPMGLANTLTRGIISAVNREVMGNVYLQTDAPVNPGNSGGPIFNDYGEVLGVATMALRRGQGLNFAVPAEQVAFRLARFLSEAARVQAGRGVYCNVCGLYSAGGSYCPACGVAFAVTDPDINDARFNPVPALSCTNCGNPLNPTDRFCSACGTRTQV